MAFNRWCPDFVFQRTNTRHYLAALETAKTRIPMRKLFPLALLICLCTGLVQAQGGWYQLEKLNPTINSASSHEMRPVVTQDGSEMYFTRQGSSFFERTLIEDGQDLSLILSEELYQNKLKQVYSDLSGELVREPYKSPFNQDIWMAENVEDDYTMVHHLKAPINNAFPNSICTFGRNEEEAIVVNQFPEEGGVQKGFSLIQKNSIGQWSAPRPITIDGLGDIEADVNLAMTADGNHLLLSIQRSDSYGHSNDLYVSTRKNLTHFGRPIHLGPAINSPYHEAAPFLSPDGQTLFFSSNRQGGQGGSDIYFVSRLGDGWQSWSAPRAIMSPVNSSANESHPFFIERTGQLYFSSRRGGTSDIYRVQIAPPNSSTVTVSGAVSSENSRYPVKAYLVAEPVLGGNFRKVAKTKNGVYEMNLPIGKTYEVEAQGIGFLTDKKRVFLNPNHVYFHGYPLDFKLVPTSTGQAIVLKKIQFKQSTSILLPASWPTLEKLSQIMLANPHLVILIEGHTDNVGLKEQLLNLSADRAEAIKRYLVVKHGVTADRMMTAGRGDLKPLNRNADEDQRRANRRVEVSIIENPLEFKDEMSASSR